MRLFQIWFILCTLFLLSLTNFIYSQKYGKGLLIDEYLYANSPKAAPLLRGDYSELPRTYSLKRFCPIPGDQGIFSTCVSWATSYGARTILAAATNNWDRKTIVENTFSPSFVYNIVDSTSGCKKGISLFDGLEILKYVGTLKDYEFQTECNKGISVREMMRAQSNKILEYRELFWRENPNKILLVKKSLSERKPVVIGMNTPFASIKGDIWNPKKSDYGKNHSAHSMVTIGYDDQKYGGSFQILNSWGADWADSGFVWIRYSDFDHFTLFGFELIDKAVSQRNGKISGSLSFIRDDGMHMELSADDKYFYTTDSYNSGTKFQVLLSNSDPAYIYSFGTDLSFATSKLFPINSNMVAYLPYSSSNFAIPGEDYFMMLDSNPGKSYFIFLYSLQNFDIEHFLDDFKNTDGTVYERINSLLDNKLNLNDKQSIKTGKTLFFNADVEQEDVLPIIVEIQHK